LVRSIKPPPDSNIDGVAAVLQLMEENHQSRLNEIAAIIQGA
jgi:hypothetical protein